MENKSDTLLRRVLKNWVQRQSPPAHTRESLLIKAAAYPCNIIDVDSFPYRPQFKSYPLTYSNDWTQTIFTWINLNSFALEFQARPGGYAY